jgi:FMN phosphatase YigB (HAD superfamily)
MLKAVCIDLDNTMVLFDELVFIERFFKLLYKRFDDLFTFEDLQNRVILATLSLIGKSEEKNNLDWFLDHVTADHEVGRDEVWRRSMVFYENDFDQACPHVDMPDNLHDVLEQLKQIGLTLVVASNPIYPRIAMEKRLAWVDVDTHHFALVTHMENMNFVKPDAAYYRQICTKIGVLPEHCLMVGNDPRNDMAAAGVNMKTYLTTDGGTVDYDSLTLTNERNRKDQVNVRPDFTGPLAGIIEAVRQL